MKYDVSNYIKELHENLGVTNADIAEASGVSASTIGRASTQGYLVTQAVKQAILNGGQALHARRACSIATSDSLVAVKSKHEEVIELLDDIHESRHSREKAAIMDQLKSVACQLEDEIHQKAEVQNALAARIDEVAKLKAELMVAKKTGDELAAMQAKHKTQGSNIEFLHAEIGRLKRIIDARINERRKEVDQARAETESLTSEIERLKNDLATIEKIHDQTASELQAERLKNKTQYQSIGQCFAKIHRLQGDLKDAQSVIAVQEKQIDLGLDENDRLKRLVALRTQDLAVYQKALETADNRADDAEYKAAEFERDLTVQRAWTWFFLVLAFVVAIVEVVK